MSGDFQQSSGARWERNRAFRRVETPIWPFVWRGVLPAVGLLLVTLFGITRFAQVSIENEVQDGTRFALVDAGFGWVEVAVAGQRVYLAGSEPTTGEGDRALGVAREAACDTWLGGRTCATSVEGVFGRAQAETPDAATPPAPTAEPEPPPAPTAADAQVCEDVLNGMLVDAQIEFESSSSAITAAAQPLLDRLAATVLDCPGALLIEGHTDSSGRASANLALSEERAQSVRDALSSRGVPLERISTVGFGEVDPIASNETPAGRAQNRRIVFRVEFDGG